MSLSSSSTTTRMRPFLGTWHNTARQSQWFHGFELLEIQNQALFVPLAFKPSPEWGSYPLHSFEFKKGEIAFCTAFEANDIKVDLAAYSNRGVLVLSAYFDFKLTPGKNHLSREFFVPVPIEQGKK